MTIYANPGTDGSAVTFKPRYEHYIGGEWVAPVKGQYFENPSPVTGKSFTEVGRGTPEDIEAALDAAHAAAPAWGRTSPTVWSRTSRCWPSPRRGTTARPCGRP